MTEKRAHTLSLTFLLGLALSFILNQVAGSINFDANTWMFPRLVPTFNPPLGVDFSLTVQKSLLLLRGISPYQTAEWYPPLVYLLYIPFALMDYHIAYGTQVVALCIVNFLNVFLSIHLSAHVLRKERGLQAFDQIFGLALCGLFLIASLFTSYGFIFSLERGNSDAYAMFFSILFLWITIKQPKEIWAATLALTLAIHIKIYPLILGVLLFWKYGRRSLVPFLTLNAALLCILGPSNGIAFLKSIQQLAGAPFLWIGNHSAASWTQTIMNTSERNIPAWTAFFTALPIFIWLLGTGRLIKSGFSESRAILLFASSIPLMEVLPSTSHDYKLVISYTLIGIFSVFLTLAYLRSGKRRDLISLGGLLFLTILISRSYVISFSPWIAHKYGIILLLQALLASSIFSWTKNRHRSR